MIPEFDGNSRNCVREFLNAASYAMKNIHPADEQTLLEAILCTKFKRKAMVNFHTRDVRSYEQLKYELETELSKRSTAHLQLEFNSLKQKAGENAQDFGRRVDVQVHGNCSSPWKRIRITQWNSSMQYWKTSNYKRCIISK